MPIISVSLTDNLKLALRDRSGALLTDAEYQRFLLNHVQPAASYQAQRVAAGLWRAPGPLQLLAASFTGEPGADYELNCGGPGIYGTLSIRLTAGSDSRSHIDVTGSRVDFARCLEELLVFIATHRAQEYAQSLGSSSVSPGSVRRELLAQAEILRGVKAV